MVGFHAKGEPEGRFERAQTALLPDAFRSDTEFPCPKCTATFPSRKEMREHRRTHISERSHSCNLCPRTFSDVERLQDHQHSNHRERSYACTQCSKKFKHEEGLRQHWMTHHEQRPLLCARGPASFRADSRLIAHERDHAVKTPAKVTECSGGFSRLGPLRDHEHTHGELGSPPQLTRYSIFPSETPASAQPDTQRDDYGNSAWSCLLDNGRPALPQHQLHGHESQATQPSYIINDGGPYHGQPARAEMIGVQAHAGTGTLGQPQVNVPVIMNHNGAGYHHPGQFYPVGMPGPQIHAYPEMLGLHNVGTPPIIRFNGALYHRVGDGQCYQAVVPAPQIYAHPPGILGPHPHHPGMSVGQINESNAAFTQPYMHSGALSQSPEMNMHSSVDSVAELCRRVDACL